MHCTMRSCIHAGVSMILLATAVIAQTVSYQNDTGLVITCLPASSSGFDHIQTYNTDFENFEQSKIGTFSNTNYYGFYTACAMDYSEKQLYLYEYRQRQIVLAENFTMEMDSLSFSAKHLGVSEEAIQLAVDGISHNLYVVDAIFGWIVMMPGGRLSNHMDHRVIVSENLRLPRGLAIDADKGYIFWTDAIAPAVERASLTGENRMNLRMTGLRSPGAIAADQGKLYICDGIKLETIDYDGTPGSRAEVRKLSFGGFQDIAVYGNTLLALDDSERFIRFIDKTTGKDVHEKKKSDTEVFYSLCLNQPTAVTEPHLRTRCASANCSHWCVEEPTKATCMCPEGFELDSYGKTCAVKEGSFKRAVVVSSDNQLCLLDIHILAKHHEDYAAATCFYEGAADELIKQFDINMGVREIYFAVKETIYSIPIEGTVSQRRIITQQANEIVDLSYDWINNKIYFAMKKDSAAETESIWTIEPGSNAALEHQTHTNGQVRGLVVVPHEQKVFWITGDEGILEYADMLLNNATEISLIEPDSYFFRAERIINDVKYEMLHVFDADYADLLGVHYNGTVEQYIKLADNDVMDVTTYKDFLLAVMHTNDDKTTLKSADIYSGSVTDPPPWMDSGELTNVGKVNNIKVLDRDALQPMYSNPCINHNGGCEHLCFPRGNESVCACELGYTLNTTDNKSCNSTPVTDDFILFTDVSAYNVLQADLNKPGSVQGIVSAMEGSPQGVTYNPTDGTVYWSVYGENQIWKKNLDGTGSDSLFADIGYFGSPRRLLRDPNSGYIYYTAESLFAEVFYDSWIGVTDANGTSMGMLIESGHIPAAMAIHPTQGYIFWTDFGNQNPKIGRADMDGRNQETIIEDEIMFPNALVIDYGANPERLYWTDGYYNKIWSCKLDGSDRKLFLEDKDAHLMDMTMLDDYFYYSSWNYPHITKVNKNNINDKTDLLIGSGVRRMTALFAYSSSAAITIPKTDVCDKGKHMCSHFCHPKPGGKYGCTCEGGWDLLSNMRTCENAPRCPYWIGAAKIEENDDTCLRLTGNMCNFTCSPGYRRNHEGLLKCTEELDDNDDPKWDHNEPCQEILCPITIPNGRLHENCTQQIGEDCIAHVMCDPGHEQNIKEDKLVCQSNGTWKITDTLCEEKCPPISSEQERAQFIGTCTRGPGSRCRFACDELYRYASNVTSLECQSGSKWKENTMAVCEKISCPITIPNGRLHENCTRQIDSDCMDYVMCDSRHEQNVKVEELVCQSNGAWKITDTLCEEKCPPISSEQEHAQFIGTCKRDPGSRCRFECDKLYRYASNVTSLECQSGSRWKDNTMTVCEKVKCDDFIPGGLIDSDCSLLVNAVCKFACEEFYDAHETITDVTCILAPNQQKGVWDKQGNPSANLCTAQPGKSEKSNAKAVAVGVGVGVGLLLIILIILLVLCFLCRSGKLQYASSGHNRKEPPPVSFENPRYAESGHSGEASGGSAFGASMRDDDKADLTKESWARTMSEQGTMHVYDNISPSVH